MDRAKVSSPCQLRITRKYHNLSKSNAAVSRLWVYPKLETEVQRADGERKGRKKRGDATLTHAGPSTQRKAPSPPAHL